MKINSRFRIFTIALAVTATLLTQSNVASALPIQALEVNFPSDVTEDAASLTDTFACKCKCRLNKNDHGKQQLLCAEQPTETLPTAPNIFRCPRVDFELPLLGKTSCSDLNGINCQGYSFYVPDGSAPIVGKLEDCSLIAVAGPAGNLNDEIESDFLS